MSASVVDKKNNFKVIVLGQAAVGKTCLIHRFIHDTFCENMTMPLGVAYYSKFVRHDDNQLKLQIWDTVGQERFNAISQMYYRRAKVAIVCVDVTDLESYNKLNYWISQLEYNEKECKLYICCTKHDLLNVRKRLVSEDDISKLANCYKAKVFNTSSKTGEGVQEMFAAITTDLFNDHLINNLPPDEHNIKVKRKKITRLKCCHRG